MGPYPTQIMLTAHFHILRNSLLANGPTINNYVMMVFTLSSTKTQVSK
jgi:hypothetical protein